MIIVDLGKEFEEVFKKKCKENKIKIKEVIKGAIEQWMIENDAYKIEDTTIKYIDKKLDIIISSLNIKLEDSEENYQEKPDWHISNEQKNEIQNTLDNSWE